MTAHPRTPFSDALTGFAEALIAAYEQDRRAESRFARMANRHDGPASRGLHLLSELHARSADLLLPLLSRSPLAPRPQAELQAQGRAEALQSPRWHEVLTRFTQLHPACVPAHNHLITLAPLPDQPRLTQRIARDLAITDYGFAALAGQRDPDRHLLHLLQHLSSPAGGI